MRDIIARQHAFSGKFATPRHDLIVPINPPVEVPAERRFLGKTAARVKHIGATIRKRPEYFSMMPVAGNSSGVVP
jgi:hypothetical protein